MSERVGREYRLAAFPEGLPPEEQTSAIFLTEGYPSAGAIQLFGGAQLPAVYSPHNSYYLWGVPPDSHGPVITIGFEADQLRPWFEEVEIVARNPCEFCMGWRQDMPIAIARRPKRSLREGWPELRSWRFSARSRRRSATAALSWLAQVRTTRPPASSCRKRPKRSAPTLCC